VTLVYPEAADVDAGKISILTPIGAALIGLSMGQTIVKGNARKVRRIFTGWMFADSPGLHAVDHAVYDVWLASCKISSTVAPPGSR